MNPNELALSIGTDLVLALPDDIELLDAVFGAAVALGLCLQSAIHERAIGAEKAAQTLALCTAIAEEFACMPIESVR